MTQGDFAKRLGVSQQAVGQLEKREVDGTASLNALRDAARVLEGKLMYAVVPSRPVGEILEQRAYRLALQMVMSVRHSMRLEDQETDADVTERVEAIAKDLLSSPRLLWSDPDGE